MIIYRITNKINGKIYIGKTVQTLRARWQNHRSAARTGVDSYLARAVRKHGEAAFELQVIYTAKSLVELNAMETFFIVIHQSHVRENGYNQTLGGDGLIPNDQVRAKMRAARLGKTPWNKGKKLSAEFVEKNRQSHLGIKPSAATRERMRKAQLGKKFSESHRANITAARRGRKFSPLSPEHRQSISIALRGEKNPRFGKPHTEEAKAAMCRAKGRRANA